MKFTFRSKPFASKYYTLLPFDREVLTADNEQIWQERYQVSTREINKNSPVEFYKINRGKSLATMALLDLSEKYDKESICNAILDFTLQYKNQLLPKIQVELSCLSPEALPAMVQAFELASYNLSLYKTDQAEVHPLADPKAEVVFIDADNSARHYKAAIAEQQTITKYQKEAMDLVNGPSNKVDTTYLVKWIKGKGRASGMKVTVLNKTAMQKKGLHAVLAVNKGSEVNPAFIIAEYHGNKRADAATIGLVGKGVTFDTGGLSIKPSTNMHYMKSDMGGAAAVLATIAAIAELKWTVNIVAITPVTDNCVDAGSIKPGDVIDSYSGKTIEIIDTDAEGRLILADALAYLVRNFEADHVIDLATLTGSAVRTFGTACAALFSNDDELSDNLIATGLSTGEKLWPLPIWDEYADEMKSDIADIKNLSTRPMAGAITAAKFLQAFTLDHPSWAHLDIAGVAFGDTKFGKMKAATGWGVHLLCAFVKEFGE